MLVGVKIIKGLHIYNSKSEKAKGTQKKHNCCHYCSFTVFRFLLSKTVKPSSSDGTRVVAMAPDTKDPDDVWGVLRNAHLIKVFLPEWRLRVFVSDSSSSSLPPRILTKLLTAGATLSYVPDAIADTVPIHMRSYLIADDPHVEYFVIRQPKQRLSDRDTFAIHNWISSNATFHCVRDHPLHKTQSIVRGLWGARRERLKTLLGSSMHQIVENHVKNVSLKAEPGVVMKSFLTDRLWPVVQGNVLCQDSVSCKDWPGSVPFKLARQFTEALGDLYNRHEMIVSKPINGQEQVLSTTDCG